MPKIKKIRYIIFEYNLKIENFDLADAISANKIDNFVPFLTDTLI